MNDKIDDLSSTIVTRLDSTHIEDVKNEGLTPKELLQKSVIDLITSQLTKANNYDIILDKALVKVVDRIDRDELDLDELTNVISLLSSKKLDLIHTVFAPFQSSQKNILDDTTQGNDFEKGLKEMTPEQLQVLDKFATVFHNSK